MLTTMLPADLAETLAATATFLNTYRNDWMVFGGAAMVLHGFDVGPVKDIDIIVSGDTAVRLMDALSVSNHADAGSSHFRSDYLLRPDFGPVPVEVLGNFRIWNGREWYPVQPTGSATVQMRSQTIPVPEPHRLAEIFDLCGRPKDLRRSEMIRSR